ncbi:Nif3-like dinuclear metal center hexameric protein [Spirochaeta dissipatitropha]
MTVQEFDSICRTWFAPEQFTRMDRSLNGLQVGRRDKKIRKIATAVDACQESFRRAAEQQADLIFVHHGLFWGTPLAVTDQHYARIRMLLDSDIALYAMHIPLDQHSELGNNAVMAAELGLQEVQAFGSIKGTVIGVRGVFSGDRSIDQIVDRLFRGRENTLGILPFGKSRIRSVGLISGGAPFEVQQAIDAGLDLYITGDANHIVYHLAQEAGINVIFGGHYATEIWGVQALGQRMQHDYGLEHVYIDVPTGL